MSQSTRWPTCRGCGHVATPGLRCPAPLNVRCPFQLTDDGHLVGAAGRPPEPFTDEVDKTNASLELRGWTKEAESGTP